jgi:hypothetical protein
MREEAEIDAGADDEGGQQNAGAHDGHRLDRGLPAQGEGPVDEESGQRERHGKPDPMRSDHQPRSRLMF